VDALENVNLVSIVGIEPQFLRCPACSLVAVQPVLSWLPCVLCEKRKDALKIFILLEIITHAVRNATLKISPCEAKI
jgi:hypothetical protein